MSQPHITWPEGKRFAFTVFDDCDWMTMKNGPPVYRFLTDHGFHVTKSVWPIKGQQVPSVGGETCENPDYLAWVKSLQNEGHEIGLHNVTYHSSTREEILRGIEKFKEHFGAYPRVHANHNNCNDSLYWGKHRLTGFRQHIYTLCTLLHKKREFSGHQAGSPYYWGDVCQGKITYVRNFVFPKINTLQACPPMPYFDPERPNVPYWFASTNGPDAGSFCRALSDDQQDCLEEEGGACIMYTHFGTDFYHEGRLNPKFVRLMKRLRDKKGWFVPVSELLDHIRTQRPGNHTISAAERARLEWRWLAHKTLVGTT